MKRYVTNLSAKKEEKGQDSWLFEAKPRPGRSKDAFKKEKKGKAQALGLITNFQFLIPNEMLISKIRYLRI